MNFIFVSPHFPTNYFHFCEQLAQNGVNVLGIGDSPYDQLQPGLKGALTEYYRVGNMENYDEMYKAVAYFAFKYGPIDWLESNNEYWLRRDAELRTAFNITTGFPADVRMARSEMHPESHPHILEVLRKSEMKRFYALAGVPTCRFILSSEGLEEALDFAEKVGYPLFCRPNIRNERLEVFDIHCESELVAFFQNLGNDTEYIIEPYVTGTIWTYDAIVDAEGQPLVESNGVFPPMADVVNDRLDLTYYVPQNMNPELRDAGRRVIRAYGARSRFVHLEFFRLAFDHPELGHKDDFVGLEINMRPGGGYMPEMMNYAQDIDVFKIWAEMICGRMAEESSEAECGADNAAEKDNGTASAAARTTVFVGRRDDISYAHSHDEVMSRFRSQICMTERVPDILSDATCNQAYIARFDTPETMHEYLEFIMARKAE